MSAEAMRSRVDRIASARADRTWADRIPVDPARSEAAAALAAEWLEVAERHGVSLADLDGVADVAMSAYDAIGARNWWRDRTPQPQG